MYKIILFLFFLFYSFSLFGLDIKESIKSTVENNQKIKIGIEKINESRELIEKAAGELKPDISGSIVTTYDESETKTSTSTSQDQNFSDTYKLTITQNLYDAGYDKLEIERSKILYNNEIIGFKILVQDLILDAITGYLTVLNYEASLESVEKNNEFVSKLLEETQTKFDIGSATLYDLQMMQASFAISDSNLFTAKQNLEIGKKSFKRISGEDAINLEEVVSINEEMDFKDINQKALDSNLSLMLIKNDLKNKEILLLKEEKTKKPSLNFTGTAQYSDSDRIDPGTETTKGSLSLTLNIPIFQQGIDDSNIRKFSSQILQSELNLLDAKDDLLLNISNTYKDLKVNEVKIKANKISIEASKTAISSLKQEYLLGTKTISELLNEEDNFLTLNVNYFNAKKDYLISYFKIKSLEGSLLENFKEYLPNLN